MHLRMSKFELVIVVLATCWFHATGFLFPTSLVVRRPSPTQTYILSRHAMMRASAPRMSRSISKLAMSEEDEVPEETVAAVNPMDDFGYYQVGQEYEGKITTIKSNGAMVNFTSSVGVIIPKSRMSVLDFEKLKGMHRRRSEELISVEIIDVKLANQTMYGKYTDKTNTQRADLSSLAAMAPEELRKLKHNATVVNANENGVYVKLDEYGIAGFLPASKLPDAPPKAYIPKLYRQGRPVVVNIEYLSVVGKEIVLSMPHDHSRALQGDVGSYVGVHPDKWMTGEIVKVLKNAIHLRPAYHDTHGVVPIENIPKELVETLKSRVAAENTSPNAPKYVPGTTWDTDLRRLLRTGDVLKARVENVDFEHSSVTLTMLPTEDELFLYKPRVSELMIAQERDKKARLENQDPNKPRRRPRGERRISPGLLEKYGVDLSPTFEGIRLQDMEDLPEWANYTEPEPEVYHLERDGVKVSWTEAQEMADYEREQAEEHRAMKRKLLEAKAILPYYPEEVLEWWRGEPFVTSYELERRARMEALEKSDKIMETHEEIMSESEEMVAGTWRRLFTVDTMEDEKDFEAKELASELQTIEDEIGEMDGIHLDLLKPINSPFDHTDKDTFPIGASVSREDFPLEIRDQLTFYKNLDARLAALEQQDRDEGFCASKKADFKAVMKEYYRIEEDARLGEIEEQIGWREGDPEVTSETHPPSKTAATVRRVWKKKGDIVNTAATAAAVGAEGEGGEGGQATAETVSASLP